MPASNDDNLLIDSIAIRQHADFALRCPTSGSANPPLVLTLHGWGQNCRSFARRMAPLADAGFQVVTPQATNQLYVSMEPKKVGFSWLTMYERDRSIQDFVAYMSALLNHVMTSHPYDESRVFLLGFSQGVSMAYRLAASGVVKPAGLVAWAADLPPDVAEKLNAIDPFPVLLVHADDDPVVTVDKSDAAESELRQHGFPVERLGYEGGHTLPRETVEEVGAWLKGHGCP